MVYRVSVILHSYKNLPCNFTSQGIIIITGSQEDMYISIGIIAVKK